MTVQTAQLIHPGAMFIASTLVGVQMVEVVEPPAEDGSVLTLTMVPDSTEPVALTVQTDVLLKCYTYAGSARTVRPGALFVYDADTTPPGTGDTEDQEIIGYGPGTLLLEVVRVDHKENRAYCIETLNTEKRETEADYDIDVLEFGAFTHLGFARSDMAHRREPRVGDLFGYVLYDPEIGPAEFTVAEVREFDTDDTVTMSAVSSHDHRAWFENWHRVDIVHHMSYLGHVAPPKEALS